MDGDRDDKIAVLDAYLRELEDALGPIPVPEQTAAREWADRVIGEAPQPASARRARTQRDVRE